MVRLRVALTGYMRHLEVASELEGGYMRRRSHQRGHSRSGLVEGDERRKQAEQSHEEQT